MLYNGSNPLYRRPASSPNSDDVSDINQWIVPYNPYLLKKYEAHINIEVCASIKSVFYLYKYVYKGPDRADIAVTHQSHRSYGDNLTPDNPRPDGRARAPGELVDKITEYH